MDSWFDENSIGIIILLIIVISLCGNGPCSKTEEIKEEACEEVCGEEKRAEFICWRKKEGERRRQLY